MAEICRVLHSNGYNLVTVRQPKTLTVYGTQTEAPDGNPGPAPKAENVACTAMDTIPRDVLISLGYFPRCRFKAYEIPPIEGDWD